LKEYCTQITDFSQDELKLFDEFFELKKFRKRDYILRIGEVCNFIAFINDGSVRHYHIKDGIERTCDISFDNKFITEFNSFNYGSKSVISIQALSDTELFSIEKNKLHKLYRTNSKFEEFGRKMAEMVALRNSQIAMSLASDKPEERYRNLLNENPAIFQKVQQKYIANFLGITPESLSRIRKRTLKT
jgi:CRP-like cAMP-binding protein